MPGIKELIRSEKDGTLSFGDYTLDEKNKLQDFSHEGDLYKVKTFKELTKLERNGMFVFESEPGTAVRNFRVTNEGASFSVTGKEYAEITLGMEEDTEYGIFIDDVSVGNIRTNMSGKLTFSTELDGRKSVKVRIIRMQADHA
jgi:hypothetical protein